MYTAGRIKLALPSAITMVRLAAAPLFYYAFLHCSCALAFSIFVLASMTDLLDGFVARKLNAASDIGAFFDAGVDFFLVIIVFIAFSKKSWYCVFIILPILLSFLGFILSSGFKRPVYDPVGKYLGAFLMLMITITLLFPYPFVQKILTYSLAIFCLISLCSRTIFLLKKRR